jgi:hypothetical protein
MVMIFAPDLQPAPRMTYVLPRQHEVILQPRQSNDAGFKFHWQIWLEALPCV